MPGLDPGIHPFAKKSWIAGSSPAMTAEYAAGLSVQAESLSSHERPEICALRHAILPRLILRPAVERHLAPARRVARLVRMNRGAAFVVGVDALGEIGFVEFSIVDGA